MNLKYIMLSKERKPQKIIYYTVSFYVILEKAIEIKKKISNYWRKRLTIKRQCKRIWEVMKLLYILIVAEVTHCMLLLKLRNMHQKKNDFFCM